MNAQPDAAPVSETRSGEFDFEAVFRSHYGRLARVLARITGDPARAEDLAVEALWKLWRTPAAQGDHTAGWLYRTAMRLGLNELRGAGRRAKHESLADAPAALPNPEQAHASAEEQAQVRAVLAVLDARQAALLLLRSSGLTYEELAAALELNPASVGTLLSRAQQAFRKEYVKRHGPQ